MTLEDHPPLNGLAPPAWSKSQLRRLGNSIRDSRSEPSDCPSYVEVITWYDDLAVSVQDAIRGLDWASLLVGRPAPVFSSRAKTIDTLRDKLQRDRATPLGNVQDVAGVRFECEMTLEEQDVVARAIADAFDQRIRAIHDIRRSPHAGYRAVHVWLQLRHARVEVQVRTHLQGAWANVYEALADRFGRAIRYEDDLTGVPEPGRALAEALRYISRRDIAEMEAERQIFVTRCLELGLDDGDLFSRSRAGGAASVVRSRWDDLRRREHRLMERLGDLEARVRQFDA